MEYRHPDKSSQTAAGVDFSIAVADRGYAWWYIDAWSDCGQHGLTIIAMLGCVFSATAKRADHVAIIVIGRAKLYGVPIYQSPHLFAIRMKQKIAQFWICVYEYFGFYC